MESERVEGVQTLAVLALRLREGDQAALQELMDLTYRRAYRLCFSLLQDHQLAEDALQEAYFGCFRKIHQLKEPAAFRAWFWRILSNSCHTMRESKVQHFLEDSARELTSQSDSSEPVLDRLDLKQAFARLGAREREVLALREVAALSYDEIAVALALPLSTVKKRIFDARKRVSSFLQGGLPR